MNNNIQQLKSLINDYDMLSQELENMVFLWEKHDDPMSDPGLQFEKECEVEAAYLKIVNFASTMLKQ